jgi:metallo-beta-lactamase class B
MKAIAVLFFVALACAAGDASAAALSCSPALNAPQAPFRIYGNSYYVGTHGVASVLITSPRGHVLIDGDLAVSAPMIAAHIRALGFRVEDVKLILNTHVHCDHAGGIAALQRMSGAEVKASPASAAVLRDGAVARDDPQFGSTAPPPPVAHVSAIVNGEALHVGPIAITAHFTPGHTEGGTSWTWDACETARCLHMVDGDSLTAVSGPSYRFSDHPAVLAQFDQRFAVMAALPCDILITAHPELNDLWSRLDRRAHGDAGALIDPGACRRYATRMRAALARRLASEKTQ